MAKRRIVRQQDEEEVEKKVKPSFVPPKFDETEFLQTENRSAKMIYLSLGMSLLAAFLSYILMMVLYNLDVSGYRTIPILMPILCVPLILFLFRKFGIDLKKLEKKKYLENGFMYAAAWLALFLIFMNPPISDLSDPHISDVIVKGTNIDGDQVWYKDEMMVDLSNVNGSDTRNLEVFCQMTDNWKLDTVRISVQINKNGTWTDVHDADDMELSIDKLKNGSILDIRKKDSQIMMDTWYGDDWDNWNGYVHRVSFGNLTSLNGRSEFRIIYKAEDVRGNSLVKEYAFKVGSD